MKTLTLLSIAAIALLVGCSSQETVEKNELVLTKDLLFYKLDRDKLDRPGGYEPDDSDVPFTGTAIEYFEDTKKLKSKTPFKDGKPNGVETWWGEFGSKTLERTWKDGKQDGVATAWDEDGKKIMEATFKDGKLIEAEKFD